MCEQGEEFDLKEWEEDCLNGTVDWMAAAYWIRILQYRLQNITPVGATDDSKRLDIIRDAYRTETASKVVIELTPEQFCAALQEGK